MTWKRGPETAAARHRPAASARAPRAKHTAKATAGRSKPKKPTRGKTSFRRSTRRH